MAFLISIAGLVCGFSWLIFVHELGHFLLAKWNGVRVYVFSVGMGPYLLSFTRGETVYAISILPLGGYVKLAGQDDLKPDLPGNRDPKDFRNKRPGQKIAILAAGAIFNLIFALMAFTACYTFGVKMPPPVIGYVPMDSAGAQAVMEKPEGRVPFPLKEGDRVKYVNGNHVRVFMDVMLEIASAGYDKEIQIDIVRNEGTEHEYQYPVIVVAKYDDKSGAANLNLDPFIEHHDYALGFEAMPDMTVGKTPAEDSAAAAAGIKKSDVILALDGVKVTHQIDVINKVQIAKGAEQELTYERNGEIKTIKLSAHLDEKTKQYMFGVLFAPPIKKIDPNSEAYEKGLREGFTIVGVNDLELDGKEGKATKEPKIEITYVEDTDAKEQTNKTITLNKQPITPSALIFTAKAPHQEEFRARSFGEALSWGWADLVKYSNSVFSVLKSIVSGRVGMKAVSGPVGIASVMLKVSENPFFYYLWFLAFLSVNLGMLQFVPLPLLDGWHILMVVVEKLKGGPLAPKFYIWAQNVGLGMILCLLLYATKNDIMRWFTH